MTVIEKLAATEFLGQEFATWLYWLSETHNANVRFPEMEEFQVWAESPVHLVAEYGEATEVIVKGGTPLEGREARQAFRDNKKIGRTRMRINYRNQTYTFALNASTMTLSGLKIPAPPNAAGTDYALMRLEIFEEFEKFFNTLFETYLKLRLDEKAWGSEVRKMRDWVKSFELS